ncbi:Uncharacterised protein [Afipia felis]|nr:Uncharacterised protein [Afipia felis]
MIGNESADDCFVDILDRPVFRTQPIPEMEDAGDITANAFGLIAPCFEVLAIVLDDRCENVGRIVRAELKSERLAMLISSLVEIILKLRIMCSRQEKRRAERPALWRIGRLSKCQLSIISNGS